MHIEPADDPGFVWLRSSASPEPERKPAMLVARTELNDVLLMLLDAADRFSSGRPMREMEGAVSAAPLSLHSETV